MLEKILTPDLLKKILTPDFIKKSLPKDLPEKLEPIINDLKTFTERFNKIEKNIDIIIEKLEKEGKK